MKIKATLLTISIFFFESTFGATGFFERESVSGFNKTCTYSSTRGEFTKTIRSTQICPLTADDGRTNRSMRSSQSNRQQNSGSTTGFFEGETASGFNKICTYSSVRGDFTKTIGSTQLCPLTAKQ